MFWRARWAELVAVVGVMAAGLYVVSVPSALRELAAVDAADLAGLGLSPRGYALYVVVLVSALAAVYLVVAALLLRLTERRAMAASTALVLVCLGVVFPQTLPALAATHPGWSVAVELLERCTVVALTVWVLTFPDGRFRPRSTAWLAGGVAATEVVGFIGLLPSSGALGAVLSLGWALALVVVVVLRYRDPGHAEDQAAIRWVAAGTGGALVGLVLAAVAQDLLGASVGTVADLVVQAGIVLAFLLIPLSVAAALLRHGLWGVAPSVGRAVTYGALTVSATAGYTTVVAVGTTALPLDPSATAPVAAGLLALAVHPGFVRLRRAVDRLLYGDREQAVAGLVDVGGSEPEAVLDSVAEILVHTLRLPYAEVSVGSDDVRATGRAGTPVPGWPADTVDLVHLGNPVGTLVLARRDRDGVTAAADARAVTDVARQLSVLAHAVLLTEQLRLSRRRLVTAQEEERRRLRNDLHDGLGPALSAVLVTLAAVENRLPENPAIAAGLVAQARAQTADTVAEVRRLVYALRPPALDELGLVGALRSFLTTLESEGFAARLTTRDLPAGLPAAVEVAAYRIACEAVSNVVRHARARSCTVDLQRSGDAVVLTVADDGAGPGSARPGVGMTSMRERAAELGGSFALSPGPAGGAVARAVLPLAPVEATQKTPHG